MLMERIAKTLSFEPTQVTLSWKDDSGEHTYTWYWSYLSVKAEQDGKPIEIKLKLTAADEAPFSGPYHRNDLSVYRR